MRAFVALDLDAASVARVAAVGERLRAGAGERRAPAGSWTEDDKVHVTLKFIASLQPGAAAAIGASLATLVPDPLPRSRATLTAFPSPERARIVVSELDDPGGALARLAAAAEALALGHGVPREERPFRPHVTHARLKGAFDARRWLAGAPPIELVFTAIALYESAGGKYTALARYITRTQTS